MGCYWLWVLQLKPEKGNSPTALSLWKGFWETTDLFLACWRKKTCMRLWKKWHWLCLELTVHRKETDTAIVEELQNSWQEFLLFMQPCHVPFSICSRTPQTFLQRPGQCPAPCVTSGHFSAVISYCSKMMTCRNSLVLGLLHLFYLFCARSVSALAEKWSWQVCVLLGILSMRIVSAAVKPIEIISCTSLFELTFSLKEDCSLPVW